MSYKRIEISREIRKWIGIGVPAAIIIGHWANKHDEEIKNFKGRAMVKTKKMKTAIGNKFKKKKES